jgi:hypothetical protein
MRAITKIPPLLLVLLSLGIQTGCSEADLSDTPGRAEGIPTELADLPSGDETAIVPRTKLDTDSAATEDTDHDSISDEADNCPTVVNPDQMDADGDDVGDACTHL